jgi:hypothetical protein
VNTSPNSLPANPTAQIGSSFAIASYSRWTQQVSAIILTPVHWEQQLLSSFEVSPARDELQPAIILHHEFSQPSWPSRWQSASLLVGSNQLPVNSVTIISELNMVYINLILHAAAGSHLTQHIDHSYSVIAIFMPGHPFCREQPGRTKLQHVSVVLSNRWLKISVEFIS